jgi:hypothetical protein
VLADQHVLERGHRREQADVLERARHAARKDPVRPRVRDVAPLEEDAARRRPVEPREHVEEGGLPCSVRADDRDDRLLGDVEVHVVDRGQASERLRHRQRVEDRTVGPPDLLLGLGDLRFVRAHARTS